MREGHCVPRRRAPPRRVAAGEHAQRADGPPRTLPAAASGGSRGAPGGAGAAGDVPNLRSFEADLTCLHRIFVLELIKASP